MREPQPFGRHKPSSLEPFQRTVERGFRRLLQALLAWIALICFVGVPFFFARKTASLLIALTLAAIYIFDLYLLRRGRLRAASWSFILVTWLVSFVLVVFRGGLGSQYMVFLLATCIAAGWLLGGRSMFAFAGVALLSTLVLAVLQALGLNLPNYFYGRHPIAVWLFFGFSLLVAVAPLENVLESLRNSVSALRDSDENLRALVHSIDGIVWEADAQTLGFIFVSKSAERILGYPISQWTDGTHFWPTHLHPDDRDCVLHLLGDAGRALGEFEFRCRLTAASGRTLCFHNRVQVLSDDLSAPAAKLRGIMIDVTRHASAEEERDRAQEALRQNEKELLEAQRVAQVGSWRWDPHTDTVTWSPELYRIAGRDPNLPPPSYEEQVCIYTPDSWKRMQAAVSEALRTGAHYQLDLELIRPDGTTRWIVDHGEVIRDDAGKTLYLRGTAQDITERKRTQDALRLFRTLLDHSNDAVEVVDPETFRFLDVNERACSDLGYTREELLSMTVCDIDPLIRDIDLVRKQIEITGFLTIESTHKRKDGSTFPVEVGIRFVHLDRTYSIAIVRDITQRRRSEEALRLLSSRLISSQDDERRRIARELHETTAQDLAAVRMCLDRINRFASRLPLASREAVREALGISNHLISSVRTLSYLLHPPILEEAGLRAAFDWYASGFSKRSGIAVQVELPEDVGRLPREHETTLFRIMQECLTNVHNHSGSSRACIRLARENGHVRMEVQDNGRGIPNWSNHNLVSGVQIGVGIAGMSERVKQFHGILEVDTAVGHGTTVRVVLPVAKAHPRKVVS